MARISINGEHSSYGESVEVNESYEAVYKPIGDRYIIKYTEITEDGKNIVVIKASKSEIKIKRRGYIDSLMIFKPGITRVNYSAGGMAVDMQINTILQEVKSSEKGVSINLVYKLLSGESVITENKLFITVTED
ncbi:MAG: DUF1934 domain-containing protein [Lachnospiraceae bacterium]|nr:DUF1934 domain-containing protein [Lachnospiraceae bacterium]